jgi:hypothetical protein
LHTKETDNREIYDKDLWRRRKENGEDSKVRKEVEVSALKVQKAKIVTSQQQQKLN